MIGETGERKSAVATPDGKSRKKKKKYMIDNTLDSLDFTDWIWGFQLNLSSIIIPKMLVAATRGNTALLIFNANSLSGGLLRNNM